MSTPRQAMSEQAPPTLAETSVNAIDTLSPAAATAAAAADPTSLSLPPPQPQPATMKNGQMTGAMADNDLTANIEDLLAGIGEDDLNDFDGLDDFGADDVEAGLMSGQLDTAVEEEDWKVDGPIDPFFQPTQVPMTVGFATAGGKALAAPSAAALSRIRKLFDDDEEEADKGNTLAEGSTSKRPRPATSSFAPASSQTAGTNPPLRPATQSSQPPPRLIPATSFTPSRSAVDTVSRLFAGIDDDLPSPAFPFAGPSTASIGFQLGSGKAAPKPNSASVARALAMFAEMDEQPTPSSSTTPGPSKLPAPLATRPIPSPLVSQPLATSSFSRPAAVATPSRQPLRTTTNTFVRPGLPATPLNKKAIEIRTPVSGNPRRIGLGSTPRSAVSQKKGFTTPFKKDDRLGASASPFKPVALGLRGSVLHTVQQRKVEKIFEPVFDLTPPPNRVSLREAQLHPGFYCIGELQAMGLPDEIWNLTLDTAVGYQFVAKDASTLGVEQALALLKHDKCALATLRWVENHWTMILWKIAGQVRAKPALFDEKWNWFEVTNQLKYRYEREFGAAQRPILRRIQERDSSAAIPMVLVVCNVHHAAPTVDQEGNEVQARSYLVLSDGWYRIRAQLDECLARAVEKGRIAVGRKLGLSGAKLESSGDANEVLDAFELSHLIISGNSCHLSPWDSRLGAQQSPFIAGLSSLSVDGGAITLMDLVIDKVFPMAFVNGDKGNREAPWGEDEEQQRADAWQDRFYAERQRLDGEMQRALAKVQDLSNLLSSYAEEIDGPISDSVGETVDNDLETLINAPDPTARLRAMSTSMSNSHIVHLSYAVRAKLSQDVADARAEMDAQLQTSCPPRTVRSFRQLRVSDGRMGRKEACRTSLLTVWDARGLETDVLVEQRRFLVSNLVPARNGDWRLPQAALTAGSSSTERVKFEVSLHTRRDTRWVPVN